MQGEGSGDGRLKVARGGPGYVGCFYYWIYQRHRYSGYWEERSIKAAYVVLLLHRYQTTWSLPYIIRTPLLANKRNVEERFLHHHPTPLFFLLSSPVRPAAGSIPRSLSIIPWTRSVKLFFTPPPCICGHQCHLKKNTTRC